jgi:hypothetical protein
MRKREEKHEIYEIQHEEASLHTHDRWTLPFLTNDGVWLDENWIYSLSTAAESTRPSLIMSRVTGAVYICQFSWVGITDENSKEERD